MKTTRTEKKSEKGFTLLEVMASSIVVLAVVGTSMFLLTVPKEKILELEMRSQVTSYLSNKLQEVKESPLSFTQQFSGGSRTLCSSNLSSVCNAGMCGNVCTTLYAADCGTNNATSSEADILNAIISQFPSMCYLAVTLDPACSGSLAVNDERMQICARAKWHKKGNEFYEEALTAFFQR